MDLLISIIVIAAFLIILWEIIKYASKGPGTGLLR